MKTALGAVLGLLLVVAPGVTAALGQDDVLVLPAGPEFEPVEETAAADATGDGLVNGGFEEGGPGDGAIPGWTRLSDEAFGQAAITVSGDAALEGAHSLRMTGPTDASAKRTGLWQQAPVEPGSWVRVELSSLVPGDASLEGTLNSLRLELDFYRPAPTEGRPAQRVANRMRVLADASVATDVWRPSTLTARAPADATEVRVTLVFVQPKARGGAAFVDGVVLRSIAPPAGAATLAGDYNQDGHVDVADFTVWRDANGRVADGEAPLPADGNGDGVVNEADREVWQANFGRSAFADE